MMETVSLVLLICWTSFVLYHTVSFILARVGPWLERLLDKATLISDEEYRRRWPPRPFLRPAFKSARQTLTLAKEMDRMHGVVVTEKLNDQRERELTEAERLADLALFRVDPSLAIELGYEVPEHTCQWSRVYRAGERPGPFTCGICGRLWVELLPVPEVWSP